MDINALAIEIALPEYDGKTDQEIANLLNAQSVIVNRNSLSGDECFQATDSTEWGALSDATRNMWLAFCGKNIDPFGQANIDFVTWIFGVGSQTISNLQSIRTTTISKAESLGILGNSPEVGPAHVAQARVV